MSSLAPACSREAIKRFRERGHVSASREIGIRLVMESCRVSATDVRREKLPWKVI
jgi:hypothetical protein